MPIPTRIPTSRRTTSTQTRVPRVLIAVGLAVIAAQVGCAPMGAGNSFDDGAEPATDSASALEIRSRTLEDVFLRVPGVSVTHGNTGRLMVRIQGGNSTGSAVPLFVVDGALMPPGSIDFLNPKAILRVEVVKNPAYTSLYGGRGANGVIRITTIRPRKE
jgi:outer membrane receptor protein involved in Fe transport